VSRLTGTTILLTGANGGFGREFARQLLALGARLILADMDEGPLGEFAHEAMKAHPGGSVLGVIGADLSSFEGCSGLFRSSRDIAPEIDVLINNAGILTYGYFHETPTDAWARVLRVNLMASMELTSLFLPGMIAKGRGQVVFMSSVAGFIPTSFETAYSVSKFGVRSFAMALAGELKGKGIDVTIVYPFWADTNILKSPSFGSRRAKRPASPFVLRPEKIVGAAVKGIMKRRLHVYPDPFSKACWHLNRLFPIIARQPVE
jgi:uncharacterized protein